MAFWITVGSVGAILLGQWPSSSSFRHAPLIDDQDVAALRLIAEKNVALGNKNDVKVPEELHKIYQKCRPSIAFVFFWGMLGDRL
jgi:hypothetical protein